MSHKLANLSPSSTSPQSSTLISYLTDFLAYLQNERRYSKHTFDAYQRDILQFNQWLVLNEKELAIDAIKFFHIQQFVAQLHRQGLGARSIKRKLSSLRSFFNYLLKDRTIKTNPALDIQTPKAQKILPKTLDIELLEKLLKVPTNTLIAKRDKAILELFYSSGLRLSELVSLNIESINLQDKTLRVIGKGNKTRVVPVGDKALQALQVWLNVRSEHGGY